MRASVEDCDDQSPEKETKKSTGKDGKDKESDDNPESKEEAQAEETTENSSNSSVNMLELLARHLQARLGISLVDEEKHEQVIEDLSLSGIAKYIQSEKCEKIIVMTGAGISTSAGIPDFRSPGTGLYDNLSKYNLPRPQSIFELSYFTENPEPFFLLAKELFPGNYKPTPGHYFIKLLAEKKMLQRNFTQNIDGLELVAGVSPDLVVAAHGTFHTAHCLDCRREYPEEWEREKIMKESVPRCDDCQGVVKPDIVFFGEALPRRFFSHMESDFPFCDLLIVMGTSLVVQPFASLIDRVPKTTPRLLINNEKCGESGIFGGFDFDSERRYRDVAHLTTCDGGCLELAELLGWKEELEKLIADGKVEFEDKLKAKVAGTASQEKLYESSVDSTSSEGTEAQNEKKNEF